MARRIPTWAAAEELDGRKKHREYDAEVWLNLEKKELRAVMLETQVGSGCTAVACLTPLRGFRTAWTLICNHRKWSCGRVVAAIDIQPSKAHR